uniref:Uncharacterized protein n=1 Tax=Parascaris univalens TaxID=6257 RepID=A0A915C2T3_PARUN
MKLQKTARKSDSHNENLYETLVEDIRRIRREDIVIMRALRLF